MSKRKPTRAEAAFLRVVEVALDDVVRAYRLYSSPDLRWHVVQEAREKYAGAWLMAIGIALDPPMPGDWIQWAEEAAEEIAAAEKRRAEVARAAA